MVAWGVLEGMVGKEAKLLLDQIHPLSHNRAVRARLSWIILSLAFRLFIGPADNFNDPVRNVRVLRFELLEGSHLASKFVFCT